MGEPSGWQVAGTASEMHERYIIPAFITTYQELVALAALQGGERVLEVACGTGMVARLGFAIATAIEPDILLLDEGLGAGDARFAARAESRMQALIQRTRILVLASHSDALIKSMCNRAILLEKGRLIEIGPIDEVINRYHERPIEAHVA